MYSNFFLFISVLVDVEGVIWMCICGIFRLFAIVLSIYTCLIVPIM